MMRLRSKQIFNRAINFYHKYNMQDLKSCTFAVYRRLYRKVFAVSTLIFFLKNTTKINSNFHHYSSFRHKI